MDLMIEKKLVKNLTERDTMLHATTPPLDSVNQSTDALIEDSDLRYQGSNDFITDLLEAEDEFFGSSQLEITSDLADA